MSFYDLDINQNAVDLLPPDKRYNKIVAFITALLSPLQWLHDMIFNSYYIGSTAAAYAPGTWNKYQQVIYRNSVYESLIDGNTDLPTVTTSWELVQDNYIGVIDRIKYNCSKLVLEYSLNKQFGATFRQPPNTSDIYITINTLPFASFVYGGVDGISSDVYSTDQTDVIIDSYGSIGNPNYTVNVPVSVYNAAGINGAARESSFRKFIDKYNAIGLVYQITTY